MEQVQERVKPAIQALGEVDDHLQGLMHYGHSRDLRVGMAAVQELVAAVRPMVAMTRAEALEKDAHGMRFMYCRCDALNPCWDGRPTDVAGQHWGGGDACPECTLRAAIAAVQGDAA
jgi:hypothetical protein